LPSGAAFSEPLKSGGQANIKNIGYAQLEDFFNGYPGSQKTKHNILMAMKQSAPAKCGV